MKTLAEIAADCSTDKEERHSYCSLLYEELFAPYRDKAIRLLEIGVYTGGSMKLWLEAFPHAIVDGVDISEPAIFATERLWLAKGDAYDPAFAERIAAMSGPWDIIIDDGPHTQESQVAFLKLYGPHLKPGGVMVIEDIQDERFMPALYEAAANVLWRAYSAVTWDTREQTGVYDNLCLVVRT